MEEQHSLGWFRERLGKITGSRVGDLMKSGRSETFGDTAKSYIYQLAAERDMNPDVVYDDELFQEYLYQTNINTKAMQWGTDKEGEARLLYEKITSRHIIETGSCPHPTIPDFASSPDGIYIGDVAGEKGGLEIKSPNQATFMKYKNEIHDNASLLSVKPEYFYQCMAHMMCAGLYWVDFIAYCPFQSMPIHIVRILRDEAVFARMEQRIRMANNMINRIIDKE